MDNIINHEIDTTNITTNTLLIDDSYGYNDNCYINNNNTISTNDDDTISSSVGKSKRPRKARSIFTVEQLKILNDEFERHNYINNYTREDLAIKAGISPEQVKIWFQNMRSKRRKCNERVKQNLMGLNFSSHHHYGDVTNIPQTSTQSVYNTPSNYFYNNDINPILTSNPYINYSTSSNSSTNNHCNNYLPYPNQRYMNQSSTTNTINSNNGDNNDKSSINNLTTWDTNTKNTFVRIDKNNLHIPSSSSSLNQPFNATTMPSYIFQQSGSIQPHTYRKNSETTTSQIQSANTISNGNKQSTFIAPGFASTLYNAKQNNPTKKISDSNHPPTSNVLLYNDRTNSNDTPSNKQYTTSTPHRPNHQFQTNTLYNSTLPPFFGQKTKMYQLKHSMPTIQQILPTNDNTNNIRPNH